jgi:thiamine transport system substrate-binding protein
VNRNPARSIGGVGGVVVTVSVALAALGACGDDGAGTPAAAPTRAAPEAITMVVYDSYPADGDPANPLQVALDEFTAATGIEVEILQSQDAGTMLAKAVLTAGNPEGDVLWGVDNTLLSRATDGDVFEPYLAQGLDAIDPSLTALVPAGEATPVDFGDVCVNYDIAALAAAGIEPPTTFADLAEPEYASRLVVENPATSSPGLAFLMASIAQFGDTGTGVTSGGAPWQEFWRRLHDNGVLAVDSWNDAYYSSFTRAGGDRPLVVSYGSSPPFEVIYATEPLAAAPTGVVESTCFRQVEFAGVLRGSEHAAAGRQLVDFLISERFQREIALNLFVFPVNRSVELQPEFVQYATIPSDPLTLDPARIEAGRSEWIDAWTTIMS